MNDKKHPESYLLGYRAGWNDAINVLSRRISYDYDPDTLYAAEIDRWSNGIDDYKAEVDRWRRGVNEYLSKLSESMTKA